MKTDETDELLALQPESEVEQQVVAELFTRLTTVWNEKPHPEKHGTTRTYYTLDIEEYDGLDHDLGQEAQIEINEHGRIDPEPGSRALVIHHAEPPDVQQETDQESLEDFEDFEVDEDAEEELAEKTEEVREADSDDLTSLDEIEKEDNDDLVQEVWQYLETVEENDDEYDHTKLQNYASEVNEKFDAADVENVPIQVVQSTEGLVEGLEDFCIEQTVDELNEPITQ